jgi:hypothetical protein
LKTIARLLMSFVLFLVFSSGSNELHVAVSTMLSWVLGLVVHRRLRHFLFLFFACASYDLETPGSGCTD